MNTNQPAITVLKTQIRKVPPILELLIADLTREEWLSRVAPNNNMLGFISWHIPSVMDFIVQGLIRGGTEVRMRQEWTDCASLDTSTFSFGITLREADNTALNSKIPDVLRYAEAVTDEILNWLDKVTDADLFQVPDRTVTLDKNPAYKGVAFNDELHEVLDRTIHDLLASTCYGHIRSHFGEIEAVKRQLRSR